MIIQSQWFHNISFDINSNRIKFKINVYTIYVECIKFIQSTEMSQYQGRNRKIFNQIIY